MNILCHFIPILPLIWALVRKGRGAKTFPEKLHEIGPQGKPKKSKKNVLDVLTGHQPKSAAICFKFSE